MYKKCKKCSLEKDINDFIKNKSICKICNRIEAKLYRERNKEKVKLLSKQWRNNNKYYFKEYSVKNKDIISNYKKNYYLNNNEEIKSNKKINYNKKSEYYIEYNRKYRTENVEKYRECKRIYMRKYYKKSPHIFIHRNILNRYLFIINKKKIDTTNSMLGYSAEELKINIENKFVKGMNWNNYGDWHIDHIKPVSKFNGCLDIKIVNALDNLQPLWAIDNYKKSNRYYE